MEFIAGDIVKFKGSFLRSVGWYTDVPRNGKVSEVHEQHVKVGWCDGHDSSVHVKNIMLDGKPDLS